MRSECGPQLSIQENLRDIRQQLESLPSLVNLKASHLSFLREFNQPLTGQEWKKFSLSLDQITTEIQSLVGDSTFGDDETDADVLPLFFKVGRPDIVQEILQTYDIHPSPDDWQTLELLADPRNYLRIENEHWQQVAGQLDLIMKRVQDLAGQLAIDSQEANLHFDIHSGLRQVANLTKNFQAEVDLVASGNGQPNERRPRSARELEKRQSEIVSGFQELIAQFSQGLKERTFLPVPKMAHPERN